MARYNTFRYSEQKYGTSPANNNLLWTFIVDWDKDGYFSGVNEAERMVDFRLERGRDYMLNPGGKGFEKMKVGKVVATFDNNDGRYDTYNTSSPLYPDVTPGGRVEIAVKDTNTGTNYGILYGVVSDIQPVRINNQPHARITVHDGLRWLQDKELLFGYYASTSLQTIVEYIATQASWPWTVSADDSALMAGTLTYWHAWKIKALDMLRELEVSEAATLFHGRDGVLYFYNRDFTHNRTKATTQSEILRDIAVLQPWEVIRNDIQVWSHWKYEENVNFIGHNNLLWSDGGGGDYIFIDDGETITLDCTFNSQYSQDPRFAGTIETFNIEVIMVDAPFTDITADCDISYNNPPSHGTHITITNNSGNNGVINTNSIGIYGDVVHSPYPATRAASDTTSQTNYGNRTMTLDGYWSELPDTAQDIADWLLAELKDPTLHVVIQFEDRPSYQFFYDLWDRVQLTVAKKSINANFRVGKIEHEWLTPNGQQVRTTMKLEPYLTVFS